MPATIQRRNTRQRQLVLDAVTGRCDHPTAEEVYTEVRQRDPKISRGTVYRTLNLLSDEGTILTVHVPGGNRFDLRTDNHSHVMCRRCGAVVDAPVTYNAHADKEAARATGYVVESHGTVFLGLCPNCR